jgi:lysophospholipase L1-like esterase
MKHRFHILITTFLLIACGLPTTAIAANSKDAPQSKARKKKTKKVDPALPMVLILGDSISMGYTSFVRQELAGKANILHNPGNSQGTTHTLKQLDQWLAMQEWDVIHFNLGLHDLKRVKVAGTSENSNDPKDPQQADLATYTANLAAIVGKLKASKAKLIFATTTPYPAGVKPHRAPEDAVSYNTAAVAIMKQHDIPVNDLYSLVLPELKTLQKPVNVHFHAAGSKKMASQVAAAITAALN